MLPYFVGVPTARYMSTVISSGHTTEYYGVFPDFVVVWDRGWVPDKDAYVGRFLNEDALVRNTVSSALHVGDYAYVGSSMDFPSAGGAHIYTWGGDAWTTDGARPEQRFGILSMGCPDGCPSMDSPPGGVTGYMLMNIQSNNGTQGERRFMPCGCQVFSSVYQLVSFVNESAFRGFDGSPPVVVMVENDFSEVVSSITPEYPILFRPLCYYGAPLVSGEENTSPSNTAMTFHGLFSVRNVVMYNAGLKYTSAGGSFLGTFINCDISADSEEGTPATVLSTASLTVTTAHCCSISFSVSQSAPSGADNGGDVYVEAHYSNVTVKTGNGGFSLYSDTSGPRGGDIYVIGSENTCDLTTGHGGGGWEGTSPPYPENPDTVRNYGTGSAGGAGGRGGDITVIEYGVPHILARSGDGGRGGFGGAGLVGSDVVQSSYDRNSVDGAGGGRGGDGGPAGAIIVSCPGSLYSSDGNWPTASVKLYGGSGGGGGAGGAGGNAGASYTSPQMYEDPETGWVDIFWHPVDANGGAGGHRGKGGKGGSVWYTGPYSVTIEGGVGGDAGIPGAGGNGTKTKDANGFSGFGGSVYLYIGKAGGDGGDVYVSVLPSYITSSAGGVITSSAVAHAFVNASAGAGGVGCGRDGGVDGRIAGNGADGHNALLFYIGEYPYVLEGSVGGDGGGMHSIAHAFPGNGGSITVTGLLFSASLVAGDSGIAGSPHTGESVGQGGKGGDGLGTMTAAKRGGRPGVYTVPTYNWSEQYGGNVYIQCDSIPLIRARAGSGGVGVGPDIFLPENIGKGGNGVFEPPSGYYGARCDVPSDWRLAGGQGSPGGNGGWVYIRPATITQSLSEVPDILPGMGGDGGGGLDGIPVVVGTYDGAGATPRGPVANILTCNCVAPAWGGWAGKIDMTGVVGISVSDFEVVSGGLPGGVPPESSITSATVWDEYTDPPVYYSCGPGQRGLNSNEY